MIDFRHTGADPCVALNLICHGDGRRLFCAVRRPAGRPQDPMEADVFRAAPRYSAWFDIEGVTRALIEQSMLAASGSARRRSPSRVTRALIEQSMLETHLAALRLDASNLNLSVYPRLVQPERWIEAASFDACVQVSQTRCQPGLFGQKL